MTKHRILIICLAGVMGIILVTLGVWMNTLPISNISAKTPKGDFRSIEKLPWSFKSKGLAVINFDIHHSDIRSNVWHITPDDKVISIRINNQRVSLSGFSTEALSDYANGFRMDVSQVLVKGNNTVSIKFVNKGGDGRFTIRAGFSVLSSIVLVVGFSFFVLVLSMLFRLSSVQFCIGVLAVCLACFYWSKTHWDARTHDTGGKTGHYGYIQHVAEHHSIPVPNAGWVYYHPPLYYVTAALVKKWSDTVGADDKEFLQAYSLLLWLIFLTASFAVFKLVFLNNTLYLNVASLALATWPASIIHSVRLGNDAAFYATSALAFWALVKWWQSDRRQALLLSAFFCLLALVSKSNAIIMCACVGLCVVYQFFQLSDWAGKARKIVDAIIVFVFILMGVGLNFGTSIYYYLHGDLDGLLISNSGGLDDALKVPHGVKAFLPLDIPTFLTTAYMNPWEDASGRGNFWNYLLRTSISGEFSFRGEMVAIWSIVLGVLLLGLVASAMTQLLKFKSVFLHRQNEMFPFSLVILLFLLALAVLRILAPFACSGDFRYVLPMLPALFIFTVDIGRKTRVLHYLMALSSCFFIFSIG